MVNEVKAKRKRNIPKSQIEKAEIQIESRSKRIEFYTTDYSIELLVNKFEKGEIIIPNYQRADTWEKKRKSRFIESVIIGLPIPFLFFWQTPQGTLEIVDGSQRLRTLKDYINGNLRLTGLEAIKELNNTTFTDITESRQLKIKNRSIRGIILNEHADAQARFDMFDRINTGSKVANTAEVRRGALAGPFIDMVVELSSSGNLHRLAPISVKSRDERIYEEIVTRFFAYGDGLEEYKDSPKTFIFEYVKRMNKEFTDNPERIQLYKDRFMSMLNFVDRNFPNGFKKIAKGNSTPRVRFEAIAIGVDRAIAENDKLLTSNSIKVGDWIDDDEFKKITTSDAANVKSKIIDRISFVKKKLLGD